MPELPEVETVCAGLRQSVLNAQISDVVQTRADLRVPFPDNLPARLQGRIVERVTRRAKYILIHLDDSHILTIHLGMSGRIQIISADESYRTVKHDHLIIKTQTHGTIIFNDPRRFGMVYLIPESEIKMHKAFKHLGPEPLGNEFSGPVLAQRLKSKTCSIKAALLDQKIVVGVGNIYACEALYESGISPNRKAHTVQGNRAEKLVQAIRNVLHKAIQAGGSSLRDYRHTDGELGYFQHQFGVYDREGLPCPHCTCDTQEVKRITQSGRSTFYCPHKQR